MTNKLKAALVALTLTGAMAHSNVAWAQDDLSMDEPRHQQAKMIKHKMHKMARFLELDDTQKEQMKTLFQTQKEASEQRRETMKAYKEQVKALVKSDSFDEGAFLALQSEYHEAFTQIALEKAKHKHAMYQILTPEQREKMEEISKKKRHKKRG